MSDKENDTPCFLCGGVGGHRETCELNGVAEKDREIERLKMLLTLNGEPCQVCWTNSWAPCPPEATGEGVFTLKDGQGVTCQLCALHAELSATKAKLEEAKEYVATLHGHILRSTDACEFIREEADKLGLALGRDIIIDGVPLLRRQRDQLAAQVEQLRETLRSRRKTIESNIAVETPSGNEAKLTCEKTALAEIDGLDRLFSVSPSVALSRHDKQVRAQAFREAAQLINEFDRSLAEELFALAEKEENPINPITAQVELRKIVDIIAASTKREPADPLHPEMKWLLELPMTEEEYQTIVKFLKEMT